MLNPNGDTNWKDGISPSLKLCKVADSIDWQDPAFQATATLLKQKRKNRKAWEFIHVYNGLNQLGCLHEQARCLGLGVGHEPLVYAFTNVCQEVVATDLYNSQNWSTASFDVEDVYGKSRFSYNRDRLTVRHMDMTTIEFPDNSFDFVWSCCAIEHVNNFKELHRVYQEIHRVLKPGGIAALTTETNKTDQPLYEPNLLYTDQLWIDHWLIAENPLIQGFELFNPPDLSVTPIPENDPIPRRESLKLIQVYTKDIISSSIAFFLRKSGEFSRSYDESWLPPFWSQYLEACDRHRNRRFSEAEALFTQLLQHPLLALRLKVRAASRLLLTLEAQSKYSEMRRVCQEIAVDYQGIDDQDQLLPIAHFCRRVGLWDEAKLLYERVEQLRGSTMTQVIDSILGQAACLEHDRHYDQALPLLETAKQLAIDHGFRTAKSIAHTYFRLGLCQEKLGYLIPAKESYQLAIKTAEPGSLLRKRATLRLRICQLEQRFRLRSLWERIQAIGRRKK